MKLMSLGTMLNLNQSIDFETAEILALDYGMTLKREETTSYRWSWICYR